MGRVIEFPSKPFRLAEEDQLKEYKAWCKWTIGYLLSASISNWKEGQPFWEPGDGQEMWQAYVEDGVWESFKDELADDEELAEKLFIEAYEKKIQKYVD